MTSLAIRFSLWQRFERWNSLFACALSILAMVISSGCATVKGEKYTYDNLPRKYLALMRDNPQTVDFTRLASASTSSDVIDRGDVLELSIAAGLSEKDTIKMPIRIEEDGCINVPELGRIPIAGMKLTAAEAAVVSECMHRQIYRNPNVTLLMKQQRTNRVLVMGAVKKPSMYEIPRGQCDLLSALSKADGLSEDAGTQVVIRNTVANNGTDPEHIARSQQGHIDPAGHSVQLASSSMDTIKVDLVSATKNGTGGYQLQDGAVVYVEKRDPEGLHVMGLVQKPGRFEFPIAEEVRVLDAIALAGGVSSIAANKIFVIRREPAVPNPNSTEAEKSTGMKTVVIELSLANAKQKVECNTSLSPGDIVSVEQTPATFALELFRRLGFNLGGSIPLLGAPIF